MKTYYFVFCKEDLLLEKTSDGGYTIPLQEEPPTAVKPWTNIMNITPLDGVEVKTYRIDAPITDDDRYEMCGLRQSYYKLSRPLYLKGGKCQELLRCLWCTDADGYGHLQEMYTVRQGDLATAGHSRHRTDSQRRRGVISTREELQT